MAGHPVEPAGSVRSTPRVAVVHLVRAANGPEAATRFLASYEHHDAGIEHELVLLVKGFTREADLEPLRRRTAGHDPTIVSVDDRGLDLDAYTAAARSSTADVLCFVNSHSEVLADGWLSALAVPVVRGRASIVGATGSWASHLGYSLWQLGLSGGYRAPRRAREATRRDLHDAIGASYGGDVRHWLLSAREAARNARHVPRFPNPHVRTNAYAVRRDAWLGLEIPHPLRKHDAHLLESGRSSVTRRLSASGRPALIADSRGGLWPSDAWRDADIFWQRDQRDLLVADNQTRVYAAASPPGRRAMRLQAWGGEPTA